MPREEPCWLLENNIKDISKKFERLRDLEAWWCNAPASLLKVWVPQQKQEQRLDKMGNGHEKEWVVFISEWWGPISKRQLGCSQAKMTTQSLFRNLGKMVFWLDLETQLGCWSSCIVSKQFWGCFLGNDNDDNNNNDNNI